MAVRMPPSTSQSSSNLPPPPTPAATAATHYARLQQWIERECADCDAAIDEHRRQIAEYRSQKARLGELQKKITHPVMVPFGSVGFMPGKLVRTNEVMVLLGANHFAECSVHDTGKIIDRRIARINEIVEKLEHQKRNARERLNYAQDLFGGATGAGEKNDLVEIREDYDEQKEAEARRQRAERAAAAREAKKVPQAAFETMMSRLDELEREEKVESKKAKVRIVDSDDDEEEEEEEYVEPLQPVAPPRGVNQEEYKRLLARLDQLDAEDTSGDDEADSDDAILEEEEEVDSDDLSETEEERRSKFEQMRRESEAEERRRMREREEEEKRASEKPARRLIEVIDDDQSTTVPQPEQQQQQKPQSIPKQKMTVVSENDRVVDLVEYQNQQEEADKAKENTPQGAHKSGLSHKRSVRFKKNLEAGPHEKSIDSLDECAASLLDAQVNPRSILRNKSEESPIDKQAFSEMEDQRATTILPAGDAFSGCIVERSVVSSASSELPIVFKPADEPPRRVSRFKLQRMQQAE